MSAMRRCEERDRRAQQAGETGPLRALLAQWRAQQMVAAE
jgi:hypothetical protein